MFSDSQPLTGGKVLPDSQGLAWVEEIDASEDSDPFGLSSPDLSLPQPRIAKAPVAAIPTRSRQQLSSKPGQSVTAQFNSLGASSVFARKKMQGPKIFSQKSAEVLAPHPPKKSAEVLPSHPPKNPQITVVIPDSQETSFETQMSQELVDEHLQSSSSDMDLGTQPDPSLIRMPHKPNLFRVEGVAYDPAPEQSPSPPKPTEITCPFNYCKSTFTKLNGCDSHLSTHIKKKETIPQEWLDEHNRTFCPSCSFIVVRSRDNRHDMAYYHPKCKPKIPVVIPAPPSRAATPATSPAKGIQMFWQVKATQSPAKNSVAALVPPSSLGSGLNVPAAAGVFSEIGGDIAAADGDGEILENSDLPPTRPSPDTQELDELFDIAKSCVVPSQKAPPRQTTIEASLSNQQFFGSAAEKEFKLPSLEEIFQTPIPTRAHLPPTTASHVARCFIYAIEKVLAKNDIESWTEFFMLPKCLFNPLGRDTSPDKTKPASSFAKLVLHRCSLFLAGKAAEIWHDVVEEFNPRTQNRSDWISLVKSKAESGNISGAFKSLDSDCFIKNSTDVFVALKALHPDRDDFKLSPKMFYPNPTANFAINFDLDKSLHSFRPGTSPGPDGLRAQHLLDLFRLNPIGSPNDPRSVFSKLINFIINGHALTDVAPYFAGARLIPLSKKNSNGVRPIAVGTTLRRLIGKILFFHVKEEASAFLKPHQFGVGIPGGAEKIVHIIRMLNDLNLKYEDFGVLQLDFINAFNKISRRKFLDAVTKHFPHLFHFVAYCYCFSPILFMNNSTTILSENGSQQGDPLGPFLFCLVMNELIKMVKADFPDVPDFWYLDDGNICGQTKFLAAILNLFIKLGPDFGLELNLQKSKIFWPSASRHNDDLFPNDLVREDTGISVLGVPIGHHDFIDQEFGSKLIKLRSSMERLPLLNDSQVAFTLLHNCLGISMVNYFLRTSPLKTTCQLAQNYDTLVLEVLQNIIGSNFTSKQQQQIQLPAKSGGLGLRSASTHAVAAYASSFNSASKFIRDTLQPGPEDDLFTQVFNAQFEGVVEDLSIKCGIVDISSTNLLKSRSQKVISEAIDKHAFDRFISKSTQDICARVHSCGGPSGSLILKAPLGKGRGFRLSSQEFSIFISLRLGLDISQTFPKERCDTCKNGTELDPKGYHCLICRTGPFGPVQRHNEFRDVLLHFCSKAILNPKPEVPLHSATKKTPSDIYLPHGNGGKPTALDITVVHPLASLIIGGAAKTPGYANIEACKKKNQKHLDDCTKQGLCFIPLSVEVFGRFSEQLDRIISFVATGISNRTGSTRSSVITDMNRKLLFSLIRSSTRAIQTRVPSRKMI